MKAPAPPVDELGIASPNEVRPSGGAGSPWRSTKGAPLFRHRLQKILKQIVAVMRPRRSLRMILHAK